MRPLPLDKRRVPDSNALSMRLTIDGEIRQDANTNQQVFSVAETIAFISRLLTLEPGDIISTGTLRGCRQRDRTLPSARPSSRSKY